MTKNRNIALCIILSIITCGIYGIYWFVCITDEMNALTPTDDYHTSGGTAFLLSLITCGIYSWYWAYKMGIKLNMLRNGSHEVLFIILQLCGLGIVNYCIMQSELNCRA